MHRQDIPGCFAIYWCSLSEVPGQMGRKLYHLNDCLSRDLIKADKAPTAIKISECFLCAYKC